MKRFVLTLLAAVCLAGGAYAQAPLTQQPELSDPGFTPLFKPDLSDANKPAGVWSVGQDGVITATEDKAMWTRRTYDNYILDLEFKNAEGTNSGVIVHASDTSNWIPNSIEIQIADDFSPEWSKQPATWRSGAMFGHQAATKQTVRHPGEWNHYTLAVRDSMIWVFLNGEMVNEVNLNRYTSAKQNPDGSAIPPWLSRPKAELATEGYIGFQGKHAGAPVWFRNIRIKELD